MGSARVSGRILAGAAVMSAVLVLLAAVLAIVLGVSEAGGALLGVLGWLVALAARLPVLGSARRLRDPERSRAILAATSAVTDEGVRLALVLVVVSGSASALWAGFGWALAELVFVVATRLAQFRWPIGREAAEQLRSQGGFISTHPAHSGVRGITATSFHLGATLLLAAGLWWVLVTASAHAAVNLVCARWARRRLVSVELFSAVVSAALLAAGLAAADLP
ncbi:hypothetical protein Lesp02_71770 [Lentzea sp. NBRC 105346]|uniref:hypothetical protein n=1 Tax=Lentzea sp. NBRC 105346 TaxID=3032205 RepID=UPI0024A16E59|nr:hypothetical protein [Lentzea sp. NBRC 105346]GLZ34990.1 hypothetical protein Lesp02_71770 [Lentzea sp. NBRC 105346]